MKPWEKVAVIGVGLLGGSLGLAMRQRGLAKHVAGYVRRAGSAAECQRLGAVDSASHDLHETVKDADLVLLCTPLSYMRDLGEKMLPSLKRGALVSDVGSVKGCVVQDLEPLMTSVGAKFVGSHPMAGAEKTGVQAARADLFEKAVCVVTPTAQTEPGALANIEEFWKAVGCRLMRLSPEVHDDLVSRASHLGHIVAAELANYVLSPVHPKEQAMLCANGFRDTTRIASSSPEMWRDIVLCNRKHLLRVLGVFIEDLQELQLAIGNADQNAIQEFFEKAQQRRDEWCERNGSQEETSGNLPESPKSSSPVKHR